MYRSMKLVSIAFLCLPWTKAEAQQSATAQPALMFHVSRSTTLWVGGSGCYERLFGKIGDLKVEMESDDKLSSVFSATKMQIVAPGDYPITIKHDTRGDRGIDREYEVEVSPGKRMSFHLMGIEE